MTTPLFDGASPVGHRSHPALAFHRTGRAAVAGIVLVVLFALLFGLNMRRGLNHDEHQFVGSAVLLARAGLLPYADFAYFHVQDRRCSTPRSSSFLTTICWPRARWR
jgi:hypothetical protein